MRIKGGVKVAGKIRVLFVEVKRGGELVVPLILCRPDFLKVYCVSFCKSGI